MSRFKYYNRIKEFNCRNICVCSDSYHVTGNTMKNYVITKRGHVWFVDGRGTFKTMLACLYAIADVEPALSNKQKVTFKDSAKPDVTLVPAITADMLIKENKELKEKLEDATNGCSLWAKQIDELKTELEAWKKEANRYKHIQANTKDRMLKYEGLYLKERGFVHMLMKYQVEGSNND